LSDYYWYLFIIEYVDFLGKSNLMDAVSFVLGDKITNVRASSLSVSTSWYRSADNINIQHYVQVL